MQIKQMITQNEESFKYHNHLIRI